MRPGKALVDQNGLVDAGEQSGVQVDLKDVEVGKNGQSEMRHGGLKRAASDEQHTSQLTVQRRRYLGEQQ